MTVQGPSTGVHVTVGLLVVLFAGPARGNSAPTVADVPADGQPIAVAQPLYSQPWGVPSTFAGTGVRLANSFAFSHDPTGRDVFTSVSLFGAGYRLKPGFAVVAKLAWVVNQPATGDAQTTMSNPAMGAWLTFPLGKGFFLGAMFSAAIPVGMGGGNTPDPNTQQADRAGNFAQSFLDQALFAPNYLTLAPALSVAWLGHDLTVQATAALSQGIRTRGDRVSALAYTTALGGALHVGYYLAQPLSIGAEIRYVATLNTTPAVRADPAYREQISAAVGVRGHFKIGGSALHPGLCYTRGIDAPMSRAAYNIIGVDLVVVF